MDRIAAKIRGIPHFVQKAPGPRRAAGAFIAGAVSALALPSFNLWPVLFLTFPVLIWLTDSIATSGVRGGCAAAWIGWCFGFGYFLVGLYWFGYAYHYLVDTAAVGWLLPAAVTINPAYLAIYPALGLSVTRLYWPRSPIRILSLAISLTAAEWLRGHLMTDFPWNAIGYVLTGPLVLAQSAAWIGIWGLTFFAVLIFAMPAVLADEPLTVRRTWLPVIGGLALLAALALGGALRLSDNPTETVTGVRLRIVQPNLTDTGDSIASSELPNLVNRYRTLSNSVTQSRPHGLSDVTHLIWPEDPLPFYRLPPEMMNFLPAGAVLITGGLRLVRRQDNSGLGVYNSIFVIDHDGKVLSFYDKMHLVPYGEYTPFQTWLEAFGLTRFIRPSGDLLRGSSRHNLAAAGAPEFLPSVCYEIIFPDEIAPREGRPGWIVNVTNDGWFGISSGPYQHFQQARLRAIEQGLPLVRAANNGISAIVDPLGRIIASLPLDAEGIIDGELPRALSPTLYARFGDWSVALMIGISLLFLGFHRIATKRKLW